MSGRAVALGAPVLLALLAGCARPAPAPAGDGLRGTAAQFAALRAPCAAAAARIGRPVTIESEIRTGGGPVLVLLAGGERRSCRPEADGSVTVFSDYAN